MKCAGVAKLRPRGQHWQMEDYEAPVSESPPSLAADPLDHLDIRVGTVAEVLEEQAARTRMRIDFGPQLGLREATLLLSGRYKTNQLVGRQVCAVVNPHLQTASFNKVLVLGMPDHSGAAVLIRPDQRVPDGGRLF